jgi:hypothetical protein
MEQKRNDILRLFNSAKDKSVKAQTIPIGKLTEEGKKYLTDISGLNFKGFTNFVLNTSDLRHIYKDHYGENEIATPDAVSFLGYDEKRDANKFEFLKENKSGTYNLIEVYGENGGKLTAKTLFNKKRVATNEVLKSQGLPPLYARNVSGASPFGTAPQLISINNEVAPIPEWTEKMSQKSYLKHFHTLIFL